MAFLAAGPAGPTFYLAGHDACLTKHLAFADKGQPMFGSFELGVFELPERFANPRGSLRQAPSAHEPGARRWLKDGAVCCLHPRLPAIIRMVEGHCFYSFSFLKWSRLFKE